MPKQIETAARHVFVYGTLRRGEQRDINKLRPAPRLVAEGRLQGVLYDLGSYPGLVLAGEAAGAGDAWVHGEIYAIKPALECILDEIEEVWPQQTGEYEKREVLVQMEGKQQAAAPVVLLCLVYEIALARTLDKPLISSGDWVDYRQLKICR